MEATIEAQGTVDRRVSHQTTGKETDMQIQHITTQEKPFIVFWENDCGYGTDYYATEAEQEAAISDIRKTGTEAWPGYAH